MLGGIIFSFLMGLLPGVDNFAHLGGFIMGVLSGIVFIPAMHIGAYVSWTCLCFLFNNCYQIKDIHILIFYNPHIVFVFVCVCVSHSNKKKI
jgi:hypothetical protein